MTDKKAAILDTDFNQKNKQGSNMFSQYGK